MCNVINIETREALMKFLCQIIEKSKIDNLADKIMSYPSGTDFIFVCRQFDPDDPGLGHRQQVIRVFHN